MSNNNQVGLLRYFNQDEIDKLIEIGPEAIRGELEKKATCRCYDCNKWRENVTRHLEHDFYAEANRYREHERIGQIVKGSEKYKEPFNPASWSAKELLQHAMQENVDQGHYIYGLYSKIDDMEQELEKRGHAIAENCELRKALDCVEEKARVLEKDLELAKKEAEYWRLRLIKEVGEDGQRTMDKK